MKKTIKSFVNTFGYDIVQFKKGSMGKDPYNDMKIFIHDKSPLIFDIGANEGQTILRCKYSFPDCRIHSFEPSPDTFEKLKENKINRQNNVHIWNYALGASQGKLNLLENKNSDMTSFLPLSDYGWGEIKKKTSVEVKTIDQFCLEQNIDRIDILKSDTQGFELEVFKGAQKSMVEGKIGLIYFEVIFLDMYKGLPTFSELFDFLTKNGFVFVSLYDIYYQNNIASWADALFVHKSYLKKNR